jgi:transcriptional regulator with XRE-family HTH domain
MQQRTVVAVSAGDVKRMTGRELAVARQQIGLSQRALASHLQVSPSLVARWERQDKVLDAKWDERCRAVLAATTRHRDAAPLVSGRGRGVSSASAAGASEVRLLVEVGDDGLVVYGEDGPVEAVVIDLRVLSAGGPSSEVAEMLLQLSHLPAPLQQLAAAHIAEQFQARRSRSA